MKCSSCGANKFVNRVGFKLWEEQTLDLETEKFEYKEIEREMLDCDGWEGIYCANCEEKFEDEDWEVEDALYDKFYEHEKASR